MRDPPSCHPTNEQADFIFQARDSNHELAARAERHLAAQAAQARLEQDALVAKDKASRRDYVRKLERSKHAEDLAQLKELASPERINKVLREYQARSEPRVSELLHAASPAPDAWIFGVDPALWQLLAYEQFVAKRQPGDRFNQKDVAEWARHSFPFERPLYRLFITQYAKRAEARVAGFAKQRLSYWVFSEEENSLIPSFYTPINDFIDRLAAARLVERMSASIGDCRVPPPRPSDFNKGFVVAAEGNVRSL